MKLSNGSKIDPLFWQADILKAILREYVLKITFTKKDGSERIMLCTLREDNIIPYEKKTDVIKVKKDDGNITVWDVENSSFKRVIVSSITDCEINIL